MTTWADRYTRGYRPKLWASNPAPDPAEFTPEITDLIETMVDSLYPELKTIEHGLRRDLIGDQIEIYTGDRYIKNWEMHRAAWLSAHKHNNGDVTRPDTFPFPKISYKVITVKAGKRWRQRPTGDLGVWEDHPTSFSGQLLIVDEDNFSFTTKQIHEALKTYNSNQFSRTTGITTRGDEVTGIYKSVFQQESEQDDA